MSRPLAAYLSLALTILFAASPIFVPDFGGFDADQFPVPQEDPPVQPEGYAFSIWGVIYLWLFVGLGYGVWKRREDAEWHAMRVPLIVSLAIGSVWLAVAVASPIWASVLIWAMLVSALVALFRSPRNDAWAAALPVGLYAGWLSAASCVSLGLLAAGYGWMSETTAAVAAILLAIVIASAVQSQLSRAPSYGVAVVWALIAVVVQNYPGNTLVAALAVGGVFALAYHTFRATRS